MSQERHEGAGGQRAAPTITELADQQHAAVVREAAELAADLWESDEELESFLADIRAARNAWLA